MEKFVGKIETIALLILGGLSQADILSYSNITPTDIEEAYRLLATRGFKLGTCERCSKIAWLSKVQWKTKNVSFDGYLCIPCEKSCARLTEFAKNDKKKKR
jgi:hypothetical protein